MIQKKPKVCISDVNIPYLTKIIDTWKTYHPQNAQTNFKFLKSPSGGHGIGLATSTPNSLRSLARLVHFSLIVFCRSFLFLMSRVSDKKILSFFVNFDSFSESIFFVYLKNNELIFFLNL